MGTTLHTFMEIFNSDIEAEDAVHKVQKISIPIIQRDYAQGRENAEVNRVRERFLDSLHLALAEKPVILDFVYGDIDKEGVMTPLDGQQRLTTLFLLHWYAAKKESVPEAEYEFLSNFSYETRYSAREFCAELVKFTPAFAGRPSLEIVDQAWFPLEWKKDPTIKSMLVMIDAISERFSDMDDIWGKLKSGAISFYFLPIKDMELTDELYIKMNSRGKPLTQFEHFKAEFERNLKAINAGQAKDIMDKIDIRWTDMLWMYRGDDNVIDDKFLRYFKFICDVICYQENGTPQGRSYDEFFLLNTYFDKNAKNVQEHIDMLIKYFDCWCDLGKETTPKAFLEKFIANDHQPGKIQMRGEIDLFEDCLNNYAQSTNGRNRSFPLNKVILLYAVIRYLLNKDSITEEQFARRLRIVNNLVRNSEFEVSDSTNRTSGNRIPAMLKQVDVIISQGYVDAKADKSFNAAQLAEEAVKYSWIDEHPESVDELYELEDHQLLFGQIGIIGLNHIDLADRFISLFKCKLDLVDCALMATGFYGQRERNNWRYQLGTSNVRVFSAWQNLFHMSANGRYNETKQFLLELLEKNQSFDSDILKGIVSRYLSECEANDTYDIRYYYLKYAGFRPGAYGKYEWKAYDAKPYETIVMLTEQNLSQKSYQPFLYEVDPEALSKDDFGRRLIIDDKYIVCENDAYIVKKTEDDSELDRIMIQQNEDGVDIEDRILRFRKYYADFK